MPLEPFCISCLVHHVVETLLDRTIDYFSLVAACIASSYFTRANI